jgi:hypothetical protein
LPYIQSNACRFLFLLFSYLRFAEAASFDKKELPRSCTLAFFANLEGKRSGNCSKNEIYSISIT